MADNEQASGAHTARMSTRQVLLHLVVHALAGMVIFAIVALPAWLIGLGVKWLESQGASPYVLQVLMFMEYGVLSMDAVLYLVLMGKAMYKAARELEI